MIQKLQDSSKVQSYIASVFRSTDPFSDAAIESLPVRAVLYPTYGYHLDERQFKALLHAVEENGQDEFFISQVEIKETDRFPDDWNWRCIRPSYTEYLDLPLVVENAIYSANGSWGILVSHEDHALLVCDHNFWYAFVNCYSDWEEDFIQFVEYWKQIAAKEWYDEFIDALTQKPG